MLPERTSIDKFFWTLFSGNDWIVAGDALKLNLNLWETLWKGHQNMRFHFIP
jgi:hypothetical protein